MFQTQIDYFRDKYNILTLDIIGHGKSTKVRKGDSIDKMSAWISEILKTEKIEKIHIVGISLGAVLAQDFANQYLLRRLKSCYRLGARRDTPCTYHFQ